MRRATQQGQIPASLRPSETRLSLSREERREAETNMAAAPDRNALAQAQAGVEEALVETICQQVRQEVAAGTQTIKQSAMDLTPLVQKLEEIKAVMSQLIDAVSQQTQELKATIQKQTNLIDCDMGIIASYCAPVLRVPPYLRLMTTQGPTY